MFWMSELLEMKLLFIFFDFLKLMADLYDILSAGKNIIDLDLILTLFIGDFVLALKLFLGLLFSL